MSEIFDERRRAFEEEYIHQKDREALDKLREQLRAEAEAAGKEHPRHCPLGHGPLAEFRYEQVVVDRCETCRGVWLDAGELELLTKHTEGGWFSRLMGK